MYEVIDDIMINTVDRGDVNLSQLNQNELASLYDSNHFKQFIKKMFLKKSLESNEKDVATQ